MALVTTEADVPYADCRRISGVAELQTALSFAGKFRGSPMPVRIHRLRFTKTDLFKLGEAERNLFVIAGHICNEVATLQKLMVGSMNFKPTGEPARSAFTVQNWVICKILAGKLHESFVAMRRYYFASQVSREYDERLPEDAKVALRSFRRYFGGGNSISRVRNSAAFHYSCDGVAAILEAMPDDREFAMYLGEIDGNSLYFFAEELLFVGQFPIADNEEVRRAFVRLQDEITAQSRNVTIFFQGCMAVATDKMFDVPELEPLEICDEDTWHIDQFGVPYFVDAERGGEEERDSREG